MCAPDARGRFERCIASGGVALFPTDTVYGLACDPDDAAAVRRLYALKGRVDSKPAAIMFFDTARALACVPLGARTGALARRLLPGGVTLLVPNPDGLWPLAGGDLLGLRVPAGGALAGSGCVVLQTSANAAGEPAATRIDEVPAALRAGVDLILDGGTLSGTASTVVDLSRYESGGELKIVRAGAVAEAAIRAAAAEAEGDA